MVDLGGSSRAMDLLGAFFHYRRNLYSFLKGNGVDVASGFPFPYLGFVLENSLDFGIGFFLIEMRGNDVRIKPINSRIGKCNGVSLMEQGWYTVPRNCCSFSS